VIRCADSVGGMSETTRERPSGPTAVGARALGPDIARGLLLLFIALANAHTFLHWPDTTTIRAMPVTDTVLDGLVAALLTMFVDGRSYTMFAALFGYGMVQIARRQSLEWKPTKKLLRRRGRWMFAIGFLHATLLFYGDIIAAYGLLAIVLVPAIRSSGRRLAVYGTIWMLLGAAVYAAFSWPQRPEDAFEFLTEDNPLLAAAYRAGGILVSAPVLAATAAGSFMVGIWAARHRLLEEPERHRAALRRFVAIGITVSALGAVPLALVVAGVIDADPEVVVPFGALHMLTGYVGGPAYAAAIALWASRRREDTGPVVRAVQATGQRSLTCYLAQSVVWHVAFAPYLLDLGDDLRVWQTALLATATWAATVLLAEWMRRHDRRGPFEVLLRRVTYR
jgi:uncharacterized protein